GHMFIFKPPNTHNVFLMKKVFFTSLFAACAAMGLSSCMNGDYDANPNANNSTANPLLNNGGNGGGGGGGGSASGQVSFKVNGKQYTISGCKYLDAIGRQITAGQSDGSTVQ